MSKLLTALRTASKRMIADLEDSELFTHNGEIGDIREQIVQSFLRPYLPDCYSLGTGQIFDSKDQMSKQIDVVIYDQLFSTVLFKDKEICLFPYESVYGTIEIKSTLSGDTLTEACENIASVRKLVRDPSHTAFSLPHYGSIISDDPKNLIEYDKRRANLPLNIIFAYDGLLAKTCRDQLIEKLRSLDAHVKHLMPDFIFNFKRGYMITKSELKSDGHWIALRDFRGEPEFNNYLILETGDDTLAFFYLTTNSFLNKIKLNALNPASYWNELFKEYSSK